MAIRYGHIIGIDVLNGVNKYSILLSKFDKTDNSWKFAGTFASDETLKAEIASGRTKFFNVDLVDGKIKGTTGSLNRFIVSDKQPVKPIVILSEIRADDSCSTLLGYRIVNHNTVVKRVKTKDLLKYCCDFAKKYPNSAPIQNAQLVPATEDTEAFIRAYIQNQFIVETVHVGRAANVEPAVVDNKENTRQINKLNEIFTKEQIKQLSLGKDAGVNFRLYANRELSPKQMEQLRLAMMDGVNPKSWASPNFSVDAMRAYRIQAKYGVNVMKFINPRYTSAQIIVLSTAVLNGVDISKMADPSINANVMDDMRIEAEAKLWNAEDIKVLKDLNKVSI